MGMWQIVVVVMLVVNVALALAMHGRETRVNFFLTATTTALEALVLYAGGFFG